MNKILSARPLLALIIHCQAFERNCRGVVNASIEALADATPLRLRLLPFRMNQQSPSKHLQSRSITPLEGSHFVQTWKGDLASSKANLPHQCKKYGMLFLRRND